METILKNIPKQEIGKLQAARAKVDKLKGQLAGYEDHLAANTAKLQTIDGKIRDVIFDGGNPASATTEKEALKKAISADETTIEFCMEAIADAEIELKEIAAKVDHLLGQAVFSEQSRRQSQYQDMVSQIESGLLEYRKIVYETASALGLPGPMHLPMIRLKADWLADAIR